ncbi:sulfatase [Bryobacter aggregatus]|uniref:sulfatase family protein n=1 Tax=Bryobacter aggregatus TaxID=360054 RepID=UPI000A78C2A8|nr:sulfatase [Bryobacter aggregatus]
MPLISRRGLLASLMPQPQTQPNILFIMSDDHAAHAISAYGSKINSTPNIDRLAKEGVRFDNCFCTNSICTPSRAAILTGQYSHINGVNTLDDSIDIKRPTIATHLQSFGYQTAMIGKWHLGTQPQGFDHWRILPGQGVYYDPFFLEKTGRKQYQGYCTDIITDFAIDFLKERDASKPFFLMCHHKAPHRPWDPGPKYKNLFDDKDIPEPSNLYQPVGRGLKMRVGEDTTERDLKMKPPEGLTGDALRKWAYQRYMKDYLRCVQSVDDSVGRILDHLDANNLRENTIVIYTSDQGFFLGDHGMFDKRLMYEESLRMPFLARYPKEIKAGTRNSDISLNIDFAPTFLDYAGMGRDPKMQGESFRQNLQGRTPPTWRQSMYYRYWMHDDRDHHVPGHYGVRTKTHKLIRYQTTEPEYELFDMKKDPHEMTNLASKQPALVATLKREITRLQHKYGDKPYELSSSQ